MDSEQRGEETQRDGEHHGVRVAEWEGGEELQTSASVPQYGMVSGVMCGHCVALTITMTRSGHRLHTHNTDQSSNT